jgi:hypothetical protein
MGPNGFFFDQVNDAEMATIFKNLAALRRDSLVDFNMVLKGHVPVEIIRLVRRLTGDTFSQWLRANADGPLAGLVRDILNYLNGKIGHLSINTSISIHEERMKNLSHYHDAVYTPTGREGSSLDPLLKNGLKLFDFDLYRLLAGIGPIAVGRIFLLHGGESYYA